MQKRKRTYIIVTLLFLWFSNGLSYRYFPTESLYNIVKIILLAFFLFSFTKLQNDQVQRLFEKPLIWLFILCPLFSSFTCYAYHGQSLYLSWMGLISNSMPIVVYWIFHRYRPDPRNIIKVLMFFAVVWTVLEILQQFTYPNYLFATRFDESLRGAAIEQRNGIWRFMIQPWMVGFLCGIYGWMKYIQFKTKKWLLLFLICTIGIYLYQTRVVLASYISMILLQYLYMGKENLGKMIRIFFIIMIIAIPIYMNFDLLFGDFVEKTQDQIASSEEDVRMLAISYYGIEYFPNILCNIFGNGAPVYGSQYGKEILRIEDLGLWRADIGVVGDYSLYGVLFIICEILFFYQVFNNRKKLEPYQLFTFTGIILNMYVMSAFCYGTQVFILIFLCYMTDCTINRNRQSIN